MDELTQWQLEEMARKGRELQKLLENSGMIDAIRRISEQRQALENARDNVGSLAESERTTALIRAAQNTAIGVALRFQATYAEMITALAGLHWHYAGIGTTLTVTLDEDESDQGTIQERHLTLPADHALALGGEVTMSGDLQIEVIKGSASITLDEVTVSATGQVVEGRASLVGTATLEARGTFLSTQSSWSIERSENSQGEHGFIFRGVGGEEMRRKMDFLTDAAQWVMENDELAKERVLSYWSSPSTTTAEFGNPLKPIVLNWRVSELKRWFEDFRDDSNLRITIFHSEAKGDIDIYEFPFTLVGIRCERPVNGTMELTPYILEGATPAAVAELQRWCTALEAAAGVARPSGGGYRLDGYWPDGPLPNQQQSPQGKGGRPRYPDNEWAYEQVRMLGRQPSEVYPEWLERIGDRAKVLDNPYASFKKAIKPKRGK